ncbi:MAG: cell surface protein SprA [Bacteroidales bacterium]|nr:cell surface protein SprA [Bacteroidales bacterium]
MDNRKIYAILLFSGLLFFLQGKSVWAQVNNAGADSASHAQTPLLHYPFHDYPGNPLLQEGSSGLYLQLPSNIQRSIEYDPKTNEYIIYEKIGNNFNYRLPYVMSQEEFRKWQYDQAVRQYWTQKAHGNGDSYRRSLIPKLYVGGEAFDRVFGSNTVNIIPQGSAELIFGANTSRIDNPALSEKLRKVTTFDFKEKIQMNVAGTVGDKLKLGINYNTEATFDFENQTKLEYTGKEDEIIKKIEAGNINFPLTGTLITGSQSLFGLKTDLQFGKLTVSAVFSQQKGQTSEIDVKGGAQIQDYEVEADHYEANKHFFLSQFFRDHYDEALAHLPVINTGVAIQRIEVWVTNKTNRFENSRNVVAFMDLGEEQQNIYNPVPAFGQTGQGPYVYNELNGLYDQMTSTYSGIRDISQVTNTLEPLKPDFIIGRDFEKIENARRLTEREYTVNKQLGFISLNAALNADEVLAVAYEYTVNGKVYKVGEFSSDVSAPDALVLKLLKGTNLSPKLPTWKLMMKNIYALGAYQINRRDFQLHVLYHDDKTGNDINYIPEGKISKEVLIKVLNLDNLNSQNEPYPDGYFDFLPGITINPAKGRVIFPVLEPFGSYLRKKIGDDAIADRYVFQELYDSTLVKARQVAEKNKFKIVGSYSSTSSSEIQLNAMNVPKGSVKVTAGGIQLKENVDYTVDYNLGTVKIINQGLLESQTPIKVQLESNQLFNLQTKTLLGTHLDYKINDDFHIGGTVLNLTERPLTQKVNIGDEPISNTMLGLDGTYHSESRLLTRMVDWLPFVQTKAPSSIDFTGEFAQMIPGHSKAIHKTGTSYIDDFEGSTTTIDLKAFNAWVLASTPQGQNDLFPEAQLNNNRYYGVNRARLAWYVIDPLFLRNNINTPDYMKKDPDYQSSHYVREVFEKELFPNRENPTGIPTNIAVLNLAFYPDEKGPYNYDVTASAYSAGVDPDGKLKDPVNRWGGIMREVPTSDFESANVQYIEFWLMDPFVEMPDNYGGDLYLDLGDVSEDILRDSRKSFENGLPTSPVVQDVDTTIWGRVPVNQSLVNAFDNDLNARKYQDVGMDGLGDTDEDSFFAAYLDSMKSILTPEAYQDLLKDPSRDDFHYYRGSDYDQERLGILERYKAYNGLEGNSPTAEMSKEPYPTTGSTLPDVEDINRDNTLSETERYYQYHVSLRPSDLKVGNNFITDKVTSTVTLANGDESSVNWYQFKIPIREYNRVVGDMQDFKSIRFMRLFMRGFNKETILRFATFNLVRGEWRNYYNSLLQGGERINTPQQESGEFVVSAVNIEENSSKQPVNYVLPPGIDRVIDPTNPQLRQLNEQSILMKVKNLEDGDARAIYKNVSLDLRKYKTVRMEVHAEALPGIPLQDDEVTVFIRLGTDYRDNYYEYEVPMKVTPPGKYNNDLVGDRQIVWPEDNRMIIPLELFQELKQERNVALHKRQTGLEMRDVYTKRIENGRVIKVAGNPNFSNIRTILIGIRNPLQNNHYLNDDGIPKSVEVWCDELRLSDFDEKGGWAANARLQARLADLGTVDIAGFTSKPGFGSIEKKVAQRSQEEVIRYDVSTNLELGKFFPKNARVRIPLFFGYSETRINPEYNPMDPDIPLKSALAHAETRAEKDSILHFSQDYSSRKSINLTNVGIGPVTKKPRIYSPSNLSFNFAYSELYHRDVKTVINLEKNYRGGLSYIFNTQPKNIAPLRKMKILRSPVFRLLRDFNFYYMPKHISFRTDLDRYYNEVKTRNIAIPYLKIAPTFRKDFLWHRNYDVKWDLTRALRLDFSAGNIARIDEPLGGVDKERYADEYERWKDSVWVNLKQGGRNTHYFHMINASYTIPINKLPLLSWITATARYNLKYDWLVGPVYPDSMNIHLGNTIQNSNNTQLSGQFNMKNLYDKVGILKKINQDNARRASGKKPPPKKKKVSFTSGRIRLKGGRSRTILHKLKTEDITKVTAYDENGKEIKGKYKVVNPDKIVFTADEDHKNVKVVIEGTKNVNENYLIIAGETLAGVVMGIKNVNLSFSQNEGTLLPGYMPRTKVMGLNRIGDDLAPGWPFVLGWQDHNFLYKSAEKNWLTTDSLINNPYIMTHTENFNFRSTFEPFKGIRVDIIANRRFSRNLNEYYKFNDTGQKYDFSNLVETGNFSMTYITMGTMFEKIRKDAEGNYVSANFDRFKEYTQIISKRLAENRHRKDPDYDPDTDPETGFPLQTGYKNGYAMTSQEVLMPAFLAAYAKMDPWHISLNTLPSIAQILPNWRVVIDIFNRIRAFKSFLRSANITHSYRSTYNIASYQTDLNFLEDESGLNWVRDMESNFIPQYQVNTVSITEQFAPLLGIDVVWKNGISSKLAFKKSRNLALSLNNNQLTEVHNDEIVVGTGYRFDNVTFNVRTGGQQKELKSDLNLRADLSIRDNKTIMRKLVEETNIPTAGQRIITLKLTADYMLSDKFNLRLFFDRIVNDPFVALTFKTANTNFGISLRFTLVQ